MHIRRIPLENIPEDEDQAAEWLQELFRQKDLMQESFHNHGDFFTGSNVTRKVANKMQPRLHTLVNMAAWNVVTVVPMSYYLVQLLVSGEIMYFSIGTSVLVACKSTFTLRINPILIWHVSICIFYTVYALMVKAIGMSKISKASSYGSEKVHGISDQNGSPTNETKEN